jgi:hypothetical protein
MSRVYAYVLLLTLAFAALPAAGAPRPGGAQAGVPAALDRDFMGMAIRDPWYEFNTNPSYPNAANQDFQEQMGIHLEDAGVRWVRLEIHIPAGASPEQASAEIEKNSYFIETVAPEHHFKVLALLGFNLLRGADPHRLNNDPFYQSPRFGGGVNGYMDTWLTYALMLADRYGDHIAAYEVLNEENRLPPAGDAISPQIMGRLVTKFYRFCRGIEVPAGEPAHGCDNAQIILGGIHPRGSSDPAHPNTIVMTDAQYLQAIYSDQTSFVAFRDAHGFYPVDGIAYHPYPAEIALSPNNVLVDRGLQRMRQALAVDPCKQFWITEVGYNVDFDPDGPRGRKPSQTEEGQALFMQDVYTTLAQRTICGNQREIANVFWFKYEDFPPAEIIYDSHGNPITYPQKWGIVRIPMLPGSCEGGCYDPSGVPVLYRQSFWTYRQLAGLPVYRTYLAQVFR